MAAAEPELALQLPQNGMEFKRSIEATKRGEAKKPAKKASSAGVNTVAVDVKGDGVVPKVRERAPGKYKFSEIKGYTGLHPPWLRKVFWDKAPDKRSRIMEDNKLCPFCLLYSAEEVCCSRTYKA